LLSFVSGALADGSVFKPEAAGLWQTALSRFESVKFQGAATPARVRLHRWAAASLTVFHPSETVSDLGLGPWLHERHITKWAILEGFRT
jgi:hypothetical protein